VATAWASAASFRGSDKRGGANGARIRLAPQKDWPVNEPAELGPVLGRLDAIKASFEAVQTGGKKVSIADLIVLGGCAAIEAAARKAGHDAAVPFSPGRMDATQEDTDAHAFAPLERTVDGFVNFAGAGHPWSAEELLIDRADLLSLTAPEMTALIGGLRVLGANVGGSRHGVFTDRVGTLTNDFFVNLLQTGFTMNWTPSTGESGVFTAHDRVTGQQAWSGTRVDLIFGSHAQLRAICEAYATDDAGAMFVDAFVAAWAKVMNLDRFDLT
jgi:catalase-peroxidase